jgi:hypothetical protein
MFDNISSIARHRLILDYTSDNTLLNIYSHFANSRKSSLPFGDLISNSFSGVLISNQNKLIYLTESGFLSPILVFNFSGQVQNKIFKKSLLDIPFIHQRREIISLGNQQILDRSKEVHMSNISLEYFLCCNKPSKELVFLGRCERFYSPRTGKSKFQMDSYSLGADYVFDFSEEISNREDKFHGRWSQSGDLYRELDPDKSILSKNFISQNNQ